VIVAKKNHVVKSIRRKEYIARSVQSVNGQVVLMRLLILLLILKASFSFSQNEQVKSAVAVRASWNQFDVYAGLEYQKIINRQMYFTGVDFGIRKTFYQSAFFPRVHLGGGYDVLKSSGISLISGVQFMYSNLKLNDHDGSDEHWFDYDLFVRLQMKSKIPIFFMPYIGLMTERYEDAYSDEKIRMNYLGYGCVFGIAYALD
jgi:hypothetical protein